MKAFFDKLLTEANFKLVMTTAVAIILIVPVGMANLYLGFVKGESPCLLCGHERFGMVVVGVLGLFMVRYGVKIKYVALVFLTGFWFLFEGLRHIGNHAQRDIGQGFGEAMFGLHTYTWAFVVYWCVILAMALMLFFVRKDNALGKELLEPSVKVKEFSGYGKIVLVLSTFIVFTNALQFLITNGPPPFGGRGAPAATRFTWDIGLASKFWDPVHWHENFRPAKWSLLGANGEVKPWIPGANEDKSIKFDTNSANSPILNQVQAPLELLETKEIGFVSENYAGKKGYFGGIAYDKANDEFALVGTGGSAYFTGENFDAYKEFAAIDQPNGTDVPITVDATFYSAGKLVALSYNKAIWGIERVANIDETDKLIQWEFLPRVEGNLMPAFGKKNEVLYKNTKGARINIGTTRAKKNYVLSLAKDPDSRYAYMVSLAAKKAPNVILLKYDTKDNTISEETILEFNKELQLKEGAKVGNFYITGADIAGGKMLALSKNYNALLVIDLASKSITGAYTLPAVGDASDIAIKGDKLYILAREGGKDKVFVVKNPLSQELATAE